MQYLSSSLRLLAAGVCVGFTLLAAPALAQDDPGSGGPEPGTPTPDPTAVPIDGGASLLLAGGAAYALNRLRKKRNAA